MKGMRIGMLACLAALVLGCQPQGAADRQAAEQAYSTIRDRFMAQEGYSYYGRTKMISGDTANGNLVNFSGQVRGRDVLLNVTLSFPEDKHVDTMSLLSRNRKLFARLGPDSAWQPVKPGDASLQQEFLNWNPIFSFQQMDEMRSSVLPLSDSLPGDNLRAIRVVLDSARLKGWLAEQMKAQVGGNVQSTHAPKLKLALTLTNEQEWRDLTQGLRVQAAESRREIDEMIDRMELEAEATVYYDQTQMLPRSMVMSIHSAYDLDGQRVQEHSEVETFFTNYGQRFHLPDPEDPAAAGPDQTAKP